MYICMYSLIENSGVRMKGVCKRHCYIRTCICVFKQSVCLTCLWMQTGAGEFYTINIIYMCVYKLEYFLKIYFDRCTYLCDGFNERKNIE